MISWTIIILALINLVRYLQTDNTTYLFFGVVLGAVSLLTDVYIYIDEKIKEITEGDDE